VVQTITLPDHLYARYRRGFDWMQKHIFPGSHLPSLGAIAAALADHTDLHLEHLENIGPHYAPTLAAWRARFERAQDAVEQLGFDETFRRKWRFYFAFCEAAFAARALNNLQLVLTRAHNPTLMPEWAPTQAAAAAR
jgi:cyclopropane-fatty-acyl-phospholipid synthase